jgi:hypothetical protein
MWNEMPGVPVDPNKPLEAWTFKDDTLKQLERKDPAGMGYNLFLPWATYKPSITKVMLRVAFQRNKAIAPLFSETYHVDLTGRPTNTMQVSKTETTNVSELPAWARPQGTADPNGVKYGPAPRGSGPSMPGGDAGPQANGGQYQGQIYNAQAQQNPTGYQGAYTIPSAPYTAPRSGASPGGVSSDNPANGKSGIVYSSAASWQASQQQGAKAGQ